MSQPPKQLKDRDWFWKSISRSNRRMEKFYLKLNSFSFIIYSFFLTAISENITKSCSNAYFTFYLILKEF